MENIDERANRVYSPFDIDKYMTKTLWNAIDAAFPRSILPHDYDYDDAARYKAYFFE